RPYCLPRPRARHGASTALIVALMVSVSTTAMLAPGLSSRALAQQAAPASAPASPTLRAEDIEQLVAPIALYPDDLIAQILAASTYPLEVVMAARWAEEPANAKLKGEALTNAAATQTWDPSVKSMVTFPSVLKDMSTKLEWTQRLGDAFLAQPQ